LSFDLKKRVFDVIKVDKDFQWGLHKRKKGKREIKNLECSINFDARGVGSSRVRGKKLGV